MAQEDRPKVKVVGGEKKRRESLQEHMRVCRDTKDDAEFSGCLKEHPEGFDTFMEHMNLAMTEFFASYGAEYLPLSSNKVLFVDVEKLPSNHYAREKAKKGISAFWDAGTQNLVVLTSRSWEYDRLSIAQIIAHELIHAASFTSLQLIDGNSLPLKGNRASLLSERNKEGTLVAKAYPRRLGMEVRGEKVSADGGFKFLNEAVTERLAREFDKKFFWKVPELKEWLQEREAVWDDARAHGVPEEDIQEMICLDMANPKSPKITGSAYLRFRKDLQDIIDDLYYSCRGEEGAPESKEAVWHLFVHAALRGEMLPLARLVERVYGKGAFRYLGEMGGTRKG